MSKKDKRLDKARANPQNVTFDELDTLLKQYRFDLARVTGSHHQYRHKSGAKLSIPKHGSLVKKVYVEQAIEAIDGLGEDEDDDE
jgi:predicted RNA binding protein YcfA (HicA-like mRNA interferase family)